MLAKTPKRDEAGDILYKAAQLIEKKGWWRGNFIHGEPEGRLCIVLAIWHWEQGFGKKHEEAAARLCQYLGISRGLVVDWNDSPVRNQQEVIQALLAAADTNEDLMLI